MWEVSRSRTRGFGGTYEGELPHKVLRVRLRNEGTVTATAVETTVYLEADHLEPLEYFANVEEVSHHPDEHPHHGVYTAQFGGPDLNLPPGFKHRGLLSPYSCARGTYRNRLSAVDRHDQCRG
jgi:hypothetical protein